MKPTGTIRVDPVIEVVFAEIWKTFSLYASIKALDGFSGNFLIGDITVLAKYDWTNGAINGGGGIFKSCLFFIVKFLSDWVSVIKPVRRMPALHMSVENNFKSLLTQGGVPQFFVRQLGNSRDS